MINVIQLADGSLFFPGATFINTRQIFGGLCVSASDAVSLPPDTGPALRVKMASARADVVLAQADLVNAVGDLA